MTDADLVERLTSLAGGPSVIADASERGFYSQDIFRHGELCAAVVRPRDVPTLQAAVREIKAAGYAVIPRGAGMSYSGGYLADSSQSVVVDVGLMDRIVDIDVENRVVTVEAGCTWERLNAALAPLGLRTRFWGPLSGLRSTVGGALSQNSVFFGSGRYGTAADAVIGLGVVLADGSLVRTGSTSVERGQVFFRHYGPDLTGLFTGDAGAFGIKVLASFDLLPRPKERRFASFGFDGREQLVEVMAEIGREQLATECFAFDPFLQAQRMKRQTIMTDLKTLSDVVVAQGSFIKGLREGVRTAVAGRSFAKDVVFPLHIRVEERSQAAAEVSLAEVRGIVARSGGREIENTIPKVLDASPFMPLNGMVGIEGERWVPVHGVIPHSRIAEFLASLDDFYAEEAQKMTERGVTSGYLLTTVGPSAMLIEPVFYWRDQTMEIHRRSIDRAFLDSLPRHEADEDTRGYVTGLRQRVINLFALVGAVHFQIGRTYPYRETLRSETGLLVDRLKAMLDPQGLMNPGALGLPFG